METAQNHNLDEFRELPQMGSQPLDTDMLYRSNMVLQIADTMW